MQKITNEKLQELDKEFNEIKVGVSFDEEKRIFVNAFVLPWTDYELACFLIHKFLKIEHEVNNIEKYKQEKNIPYKKRYVVNQKLKLLDDLRDRLENRQCLLIKIYEDCPLISGEYVATNDYVEVFGKCINIKENTELNIKLENKLPSKKQKTNSGKI